MFNKKILIAFCFTLLLLLSANASFAEIKTFVKEYTYQASEEDSRNSSRTVSLREVKRLLLEQLGTYLESITEVQNFHLTKDQIVTLTAGIVSTEVMEETWDGKVYWLKAKISADQESVIKSIDKLRQDRQKVKELEETRKRSEALLKENERLKKELLTEKGKKEQEVKQRYERNIANLTATEWFEKGYSYITSQDYDKAIETFTEAICLNPKHADAYKLRGFAYTLKAGKMRDVINSAELTMNLDAVTSSIPLYDKAIEDYNKARQLQPNDLLTKSFSAAAYTGRAVLYSLKRDYENAIQDCDNAIVIDPDNVESYIIRGGIYGSIGQFADAEKDFKKAIAKNPDYTGSAYYSWGIMCLDQGQDKKAVFYLKKSCSIGSKMACNTLQSLDKRFKKEITRQKENEMRGTR